MEDRERISKLEWRADAIDIWRDLVDSWRGGVERDLQMIHDETIKQEVRKQVREEAQTLRLTREQKLLGLLGFALAAADAIKGLWG